MKCKTSGFGTSLISREVALDIGNALYEPNVCEHIPGVANLIADHLSRREVSSSSPLPSQLCQARQVSLEDRVDGWWRSL